MKNTVCPICGKKLGFIKHEFAQGVRICNTCLITSVISGSGKLANRGQKSVTIDEIKDEINQSSLNKSNEDNCSVCGSKLTSSTAHKIADAEICDLCVTKSHIKKSDLPVKSLSDVKYQIDGTIIDINPTKKIRNIVHFNDNTNKLLIIPTEVINYSDINTFELIEDGDAIAKGGIGIPAVGGAFDGPGAIVDSIIDDLNDNCASLQIKLTVENSNTSAAYITFLRREVKKNSVAYTSVFNQVRECLSILQKISIEQEKKLNISNTVSTADEILKFKNLLDAKAITEEEYNIKKKELLDT